MRVVDILREELIIPQLRSTTKPDALRELAQHLAGLPAIRPLFHGLPAGVCPLYFPVLVTDRPRWLAALHARGVPAIGWWAGYHRQLPWADFAEARHLKDHLLALPVDQDRALGEEPERHRLPQGPGAARDQRHPPAQRHSATGAAMMAERWMSSYRTFDTSKASRLSRSLRKVCSKEGRVFRARVSGVVRASTKLFT